ncbi:carbohydrate-binding protein [Pseudoalteromonas sp. MSK9-3]|uniref:carbohydrate-binding protein n=1 Tax=Pseudoalteromonas sp. MSK9-3 TaxID=1897633 RepID=UPI000E6BECE8|nr:carbohydrate-binding protein [Pseudoalteromonas sp. MSK9-3]
MFTTCRRYSRYLPCHTHSDQSTKSSSVVISDSNCNVGAWDSSTVYLKGDQASQNGSVYEAKWWTQAQSPADYSSTWAVWKWLRNCN